MHYNQIVKISKNTCLLIGLAVLALVSVVNSPVAGGEPNGYDLAAVVNAYRAANGYYALSPNSLVMSAAQTHAEWIVATGQGGHIGASGSNETIRVSWTGYGGGAAIQCDENWAIAGSINDAMSGAWSDWTHQEVMLNAWGNRYTDIGGGVAAWGEGSYVFILNVCMVVGQGSGETVPDDGETAPEATADYSNYVYSVTLATPQADGTITHTVLYGQTLASIANAYGVTIETLRDLNNMAADYTAIWVDDELIIQQGSGTVEVTATPETDASLTPEPTALTPTHTPRPTAIQSPAPPTAEAQSAPDSETEGPPPPWLGILLVAFSGGGLILYLIYTSIKK